MGSESARPCRPRRLSIVSPPPCAPAVSRAIESRRRVPRRSVAWSLRAGGHALAELQVPWTLEDNGRTARGFAAS